MAALRQIAFYGKGGRHGPSVPAEALSKHLKRRPRPLSLLAARRGRSNRKHLAPPDDR